MTSKDSLRLRNHSAVVLMFVVTLISKFATASVPAYAFGVGSFGVASRPTAIAIGDLNGDGRADLVVSDGSGVSVLLGMADGSFAPHVEYSTGQFAPVGLALGDFNGDGKLDIVTIVGPESPSFQVLLGNGDGTFKSATSVQLSSLISTSSVAVADFNKDGKSDIAIAGSTFGGPVVAVLLGKGDGTVGMDVEYSTAGSSSMIAEDFNGDGNIDLALASGYSGVSVLVGKGDGTFGSYIITAIPTNGAGSVAAADLNHDGKLDLVAGCYPYFPGGVSVLLGNGDGTFGSPVFYPIQPLGNGPNVVAIADFNGDGRPDIVSANYDGYDTSVFLGNGDGTFKSAKNYPGSINPVGVVTGDFNGDGIKDIASVAGYNTSAAVTVLIGWGTGTFTSHVNHTIAPSPYDMSAGDFNGDGNLDIVVDSFKTPGAVSVLSENGNGGFTSYKDSNIGNSPSFLTTGDFNGDGRLDVVVVDSDSKNRTELLSTMLGNGDGTLQSPLNQTITSIPAGQFAVADFNLDSKLDLATCFQGTTGPSVFLGKGDGTFAAPVFFDAGGTCGDPGSSFTADVNGDHKPDILVTTYNGVSVLLGEGNGSFQPYSAILAGYTLQGIRDFNGDGKQDLVVSAGSPFVGIALGNGDGTFQAPQTVFITAILNVDHAVVGDFNGDGKPDLAFVSQSGMLSILLGNGDGTFGERIDLPTENSPWSLAAADFISGNGLDLVVANYLSQMKGTLSMFGNRPVAALYPGPLEFGSVKIGTTKTLNTQLFNSGGGGLRITAIEVSSEYSQTNTCGSTLAVGSSCTVSVTFTPTGSGRHNGSLRIQDNAAAKPQVVALRASGVK